MNKVFEGKANIKVRVLCDSVSSVTSDRLTTFELEYPRIIHAEFMTHRMISRNAASSRAIPFAKMAENLKGIPARFGANVSGMQDNGDHDAYVEGRSVMTDAEGGRYLECHDPEEAWEEAKQDALFWSKSFSNSGYHKQVFNRLTEPFQMMKVVASATEWDNFFWLRNHSAADPTLQELARLMWEAREDSKPQKLAPGQWHLPYIETYIGIDGNAYYYLDESSVRTMSHISLLDAITTSCARCAAVSFRNTDYDVEKSRQVYDRLVGDERKHASAFEHCATPMKGCEYVIQGNYINDPNNPLTWQEGISHMDRKENLWSGNFKGFLQYRKLIPGENYEGQSKA